MTSAVRPTVVLTVSGERPGYLAETLDSWSRARGAARWRFGFHVEPGSRLDECRSVIAAFSGVRTAAATGSRFVGPRASRSDNIGELGGAHALPEDFAATRAATFAAHREPVAFREPASGPSSTKRPLPTARAR